MNLKDTVKLANGVEMPRLGFGVWKVKDGDEAVNSVKWAIEAGYVSIDTAAAYKNEEGVGQAIKESGVKREDLFVTTKLWNAEQGYESTLAAFDESLRKLELDYVDLYLIHWPVKGKFKDTWRAFEKLYNDKRVRAIGVCNFHEHHLKELMEDAEIAPMVNQIELHPELTQEPLRNYCAEHNIVVEAWSPLGNGKLLDNAEIKAIAEAHGKSVAQVILRWDLQIGVVTIPKSVHQERIIQNADIFDFELTEDEVAKISALNKDKRTGPDPDNFNF
ncbi:aldo/keto reductase [Listeria seeligeri]|uniref:Aldo/keto reductase n=2 Tax=Listeria seeligeri TaxID=1640 RepID=A0A7X0X3T0_LISSE|nr:aldo/keto reductase [Listeria seeligeri]EFS03897.1 2,5-diketo-D-gluconic acid reductase A [Listeria seeligeri FSL S4-171]EFS00844.1 2,5-diketo-D-gluconic acid reductase A [Listeria seeligeri FSL N1-067]KKD44436.1 glyoxal reductase [Listeria seeligeri]MBC1429860.1 aldo/keto reductase [Listeria seeligeri]MBC1443567.1 aldo/keto reductase [Listeria seeligeri]